MKEGDDGAEEEEEGEEVFDDEQLNNMITREEEEVGILCVRTLMEIGFLTTQDVNGVGLVTIILSQCCNELEFVTVHDVTVL